MSCNRFRSMMLISAVGAALMMVGPAAADITDFGGFQLNGGATLTPDNMTLTLTDGLNSEARSAFSTAGPVSIGSFTVAYTYTSTGGADGFAFVLHNDSRGTSALGDAGGSLGWKSDNGSIAPIAPSAAMTYNLYGGSGSGYSNSRSNQRSDYGTGPVNITNGNPIKISLSYNGWLMVETLTDTVTNSSITKRYAANIAADVSGSTAIVGFTGATGGIASTQTVGNFSFHETIASTPIKLSPIAATGYNQDVVVEAGAVNDASSHYLNAVSSTLDGGIGKGGATFYESGLAGTSGGLPAAGVAHPSVVAPNVSFAFQPYDGNNALQLDGDNTSGTLTLNSPQAYTMLAVLATTGNGGNSDPIVTIHFADGTPDATATYFAPDWYNRSQYAFTALDRLDASSGNIDNNTTQPSIYEGIIDLSAMGLEMHPIASLEFAYGGSGHTEIFGISGALTVPEPASLGLLSLGVLGLLNRRRRR